MNLKKTAQGFTLVELLVVITILIIMGIVVVIMMNPFEIQRRTRDSVRITDINSVRDAINVAAQEASTSAAQTLCYNTTAPCSGNSTDAGTGTRSAGGSGWVKVNLAGQKTVSIPVLPIDPTNNSTYFYSYSTNAAGDAYELNAVLESEQYKDKMRSDGGNDDAKLEVGTNLNIL